MHHRCYSGTSHLWSCRASPVSTAPARARLVTLLLVRTSCPGMWYRLTETVLFPRHLTLQRRAEVISHIQTFRDYFHYHIKASKAFIHSRMRKRTADFLQSMLMRFVHYIYICRLTMHSPPQSEARSRGEGAQDCQWSHLQGTGIDLGIKQRWQKSLV
jgi:hypothetical protein